MIEGLLVAAYFAVGVGMAVREVVRWNRPSNQARVEKLRAQIEPSLKEGEMGFDTYVRAVKTTIIADTILMWPAPLIARGMVALEKQF